MARIHESFDKYRDMDQRVKLRHIRTFVEICRRQSLKGAAEALHLTQPAVSKTLKELEDLLGAQLMRRDRGGVRLSDAGETFHSFAVSSLRALDQGLTSLQRQNGHARVAVGALPSVAARVLPLASIKFRGLSPDVTIYFEEGTHGSLIQRLRQGALDLVVGRMGPPASMKGVSFAQLYSESVAMVVRPDHPLREGATPASLLDWPVIFPPEGSAIRPLVDRLLLANGMARIPNRLETVSGAFGRELVRSTNAIWIISEGVVAGDIALGALRKLPIASSLTEGPVGIMARIADTPKPAADRFARAVTDAVEALAL